MRARGVAWRPMLWIWVPVVLLCLANFGLYVWQSGWTGGRYASVHEDVQRLQTRAAKLHQLHERAQNERQDVAALENGLNQLYKEVFGSLKVRLTGILREVGAATQGAGLRPDQFSYDAQTDKKLGLVELGIRFSVAGTYNQIQRMLQALHESPQFLTVDHISIDGDEAATSTKLQIAVHVTTYLAEADQALLQRLTGVVAREESADGKE